MRLDLTMSKFEGMDVTVGYEVVINATEAFIFGDDFEDSTTDAWSSQVP